MGTPFGEWAYVTPDFPEGVGESRLRFLPPHQQRLVAALWFFANFEPVDDAAPVDLTGDLVRRPYDALGAEFGGLIPPAIIIELWEALSAQNRLWRSRQDNIGKPPLTSDEPVSKEQVRALLSRAEEAVEAARDIPIGIGHNSGFTLPDSAAIQEISVSLGEARKAIEVGPGDEAKAQRASDRLRAALGRLKPYAEAATMSAAKEFGGMVGKAAGTAFVGIIAGLISAVALAALALIQFVRALPLFG